MAPSSTALEKSATLTLKSRGVLLGDEDGGEEEDGDDEEEEEGEEEGEEEAEEDP